MLEGMRVLAVNAGSSSVRLGLFGEAPGGVAREASLHLEGEGDAQALAGLLQRGPPVRAVAHRVVHGGARFAATVPIDAAVEAAIEALVPLAPLHNAPALGWIRAARRATGAAVPHFAVFDTAFFADLPEASRTYALPAAWRERHGLRRFGFHGLAHAWMWRRWAARHPDRAARGRIVTFQLGSGCSAAAIAGGRPVETSMGFTPLEGLVMATRAGSVDPGILTYLLRQGLAADALDAGLARDSGLRGIAGESDMRALVARGDADARLAIDLYVRAAPPPRGLPRRAGGRRRHRLRRGRGREPAGDPRAHPRGRRVGGPARRRARERGAGNRALDRVLQLVHRRLDRAGRRGRDPRGGSARGAPPFARHTLNAAVASTASSPALKM